LSWARIWEGNCGRSLCVLRICCLVVFAFCFHASFFAALLPMCFSTSDSANYISVIYTPTICQQVLRLTQILPITYDSLFLRTGNWKGRGTGKSNNSAPFGFKKPSITIQLYIALCTLGLLAYLSVFSLHTEIPCKTIM